MVLHATFTDGTLFRSILNAIQEIIDTCLITVSKAGLRISRLDENQVVMVDLWLPRECFLRYQFKFAEDEQEVGVSIKELKKLMTWMTADPVEIHIVQKTISFTQKGAGVYSERTLRLPLIEDVSRDEEAQPPDQDYNGKATFSNSLFSGLLKSHMENHDTVAITLTKNTFTFELAGHEQINGKTTLNRTTDDPDNPALKIITKERKLRQLLPTSQFKKFSSASDFARTVDISLVGGEDPVKVSFNIGDETGYLAFYVAPKIET
jgi:proliferating cell nuclear antigen PCNA